ncbi:hypothetical protein CBS101457_002333 [Exobasidium rhododendri]|nr:hypothetical protein CBS101457_002333 [Exobasidium rhododendri]
MPTVMSRILVGEMQHWLDQYHLKKRIGSTSTLEACQRHRNEKETIPEGLKRGWRKELNEDSLPRRVMHEQNPFIGVMKKRIDEPSSSEWFRLIVENRRKYGKSVEGTTHQMTQMEEMHAGYYGEKGWEVLEKTLVNAFIKEADPDYDLSIKEIQPDRPLKNLTDRQFVERVLMPELICMLIINDQKARGCILTMEEAKRLRDESTEYGIAMFPSNSMTQIKTGAQSQTDSVFCADDDESDKVSSPPRKGKSGKVGKGRDDDYVQTSTRDTLVKRKEKDAAPKTIKPFNAKGPRRNAIPSASQSAVAETIPRPRPRPRPSASWPSQSITFSPDGDDEKDPISEALTWSSNSQESAREVTAARQERRSKKHFDAPYNPSIFKNFEETTPYPSISSHALSSSSSDDDHDPRSSQKEDETVMMRTLEPVAKKEHDRIKEQDAIRSWRSSGRNPSMRDDF